MALNPCWMPLVYLWLCRLICDCFSHQGPNYLFSVPCHLFWGRGWELLTALSLGHSLSCSNPFPFPLSDLNLVTKRTGPVISPAQNLLWWSSFHKPALLGLFSSVVGICFIQQNCTEQNALGIQSCYHSLKFSVFVCQVRVKVPAPSASHLILPCKVGMR